MCQCAQGYRGANCYESDGMWIDEHARVCVCGEVLSEEMRELNRFDKTKLYAC
jgi:hypothetical protein